MLVEPGPHPAPDVELVVALPPGVWEHPRAEHGFSALVTVEQRQPSFLLDGSVLVTREVDRTNDFEPGFPVQQARHDGAHAA